MEASHLNWSGGSEAKLFFPPKVPLLSSSSSSSSRPPPLPSKRVSKGEEKKKSLVLITNERDEKSSWWLDGQENFVWTSVAIIVNISYTVDVFLNVREIHSILFLGFFALSNYTA